MTSDHSGPGPCTRCGRPLRPTDRFCPECGLPSTGGVLSSEIGVVRERAAHTEEERPRWRRILPRVLTMGILGFVVVLGAVLFDRELAERFVPPVSADGPTPIGSTPSWEPEWTPIPAGVFHVGEPLVPVDDRLLMAEPHDVDDQIARYGISNREWRAFLIAREDALKAEGMWYLQARPLESSGWHPDDDGLLEPPRNPETGEPEWDALVTDVSLEAVRRFVAWTWTDPNRLIEHLGISNGEWAAFLEIERDTLAAEGLLEACTPEAWLRDEAGHPTPPLEADGDDSEPPAPDTTGLVTGVARAAVERYYEWRTRREFKRGFWLTTHEIRNELWRDFLEHEEATLVEEGLWLEANPRAPGGWEYDAESGRWTPSSDQLDHPVVNVTARAVRRFAEWLTVRLAQPGVQIRMPTSEEWEYAARGGEGRLYAWGDEFLGVPAEGTGDGRPRMGINANRSLMVHHIEEDTSPFGVVAMGTNVAEWVAGASGTELRGGSYADDLPGARINAKAWHSRPMEESQRFNHVGVRLVKVTTGP